MEIETPQHLVDLLKQVTLSPKDKKKLNIELANDARKFFRKQISEQRDIDGKAYFPRASVARKRVHSLGLERAGKAEKNMMTGLSRMLKTFADKDSFSVGIMGIAGTVAVQHNFGKTFKFTYRRQGFLNKETGRWEGGIKTPKHGKLPERKMLGWTKKLEMQLAHKIMKHITPG